MASEDSENAIIASGGSSSDNTAASPGFDVNENGSLHSKKRRKRTSISCHQLKKLEDTFKGEQWPCRETKERLAEDIGMSAQFVNIWFQNKRARIKKDFPEEQDLTVSPSSSPRSSSPSKIQIQNKPDSSLRSKPNDVPPVKEPLPSSVSILKDSKRICSHKPQHKGTQQKSQKAASSQGSNRLITHSSKTSHLSHMDELGDWQQEVPSTVSLFQCIIDMIAVEEGILNSNTQPRFNDAVNDALYGVYLNDGSVLTYSPEKGLDFI